MSLQKFFYEKEYCSRGYGGGVISIPDANGDPIYLFCDTESLRRMMDAGYKVIRNENLDNHIAPTEYLTHEFSQWLRDAAEYSETHGEYSGVVILEK